MKIKSILFVVFILAFTLCILLFRKSNLDNIREKWFDPNIEEVMVVAHRTD